MLSDGLLALDPGHYIEVLLWKNRSTPYSMEREKGWELEILPSQASTNPFRHI